MLRLILNTIFAWFWILYFILYYFLGYNELLFHIFVWFKWWKEIYSFLNWIIAALAVLGVIGFFVEVFKSQIEKKSPSSNWASFVIKIINFTKYFFALQAFSHFAIVTDKFYLILNKIYSIWLIVLFLIFLSWLIRTFVKWKVLKNSRINTEWKTLLLFLEKVLVFLIWVIWAITIFDNLGYNISAFIAWAWIWWLAIAFAAQKSIANIFWAITILLNKPFKYWDMVKINWLTWKVDTITLTHVRLIESKWHFVYIPNDAIISSNIENLSTRRNRRTEFLLSVDNKTTSLKLEKWIAEIKAILEREVELWRIDSFRVTFDWMNHISIDVKVLYFSLLTKDFGEYAAQKEDVNFQIKKSFEKLRIKMSDPASSLLLNTLPVSAAKANTVPDPAK